MPFGVHRVPDDAKVVACLDCVLCLHCLSAFTAFPTLAVDLQYNLGNTKSPLPFGVHRVPDSELLETDRGLFLESPLPFGVHRVPDTERNK